MEKRLWEAAERRRASTYPRSHPAGWYEVLPGEQLAPGGCRRVHVLGEDIALFRTADGRAHALAAACPHLGANLGVGGRVVGDTIECPFHGWRYAGDGTLACVPYSERTPEIRTRTWPLHEAHGLVFLWHGKPGADGAPPYAPDLWPELDTGRFVRRGRYEPRDIRMHLLEFAENGVDAQHFGKLHGAMRIPWTRWRVPLVGIRHVSSWRLDETRPHVAHFVDEAVLTARGRPLPATAARGHALFLGPASVVLFRISIPRLGDVLIAHTHTPLGAPGEELRLQVRFTWWSERTVGRLLTWYVVGNWVSQWWQDVGIWESKVHLAKPALVRGDGNVHELRRWFAQFCEEEPSGDPSREEGR